MEHYFTNNDHIKSELRSINYTILNTSFVFYTDNGVFSKNKIDFGTDLLINTYLKTNNTKKKILDVGCGIGVIGLTLAKLTNSTVDLIDINKRSVHLTKMNIKSLKLNANAYTSNVYENVKEKYDIIITNPPIRAGKKVYMSILNEARDYLNASGELWFVIRAQQGAKTVEKQLEEKYIVELINKEKGYYIFKAKTR